MTTHMATVGVKGLKQLPAEATIQQVACTRSCDVEFEYVPTAHLLHAMLILW